MTIANLPLMSDQESIRPCNRFMIVWPILFFISLFFLNSKIFAQASFNDFSNGANIEITSPMLVPDWALAERALLDANEEAVQIYAKKFLDDRGYMPVEPNWGVGDGPDDLMENIRNWPLAYILGGSEILIKDWEKAWEGHLKQFGETKIPEVEMAQDGIYYKEFTPAYDWEHISEGLGGFYYYGLAKPTDSRYLDRLERYSGFYIGEDSEAQNYDPEHKIIRSLFNGSRGPKLTPATVNDWDGPVGPEVDPNSSRRTRFLEATNLKGDHPLNLNSTMIPLHAFMLTQDQKYSDWVLEYVDAWSKRIDENGGNIPSNIGLDGTIGGEWDGKWYGGIFGWNSPDGGVRNYVFRGPPEAFGGALLLTGDQKYVDVLRGQFDNLFDASKTEGGKLLLPRYYGDDGWYGYSEIGGNPSGALGNQINVLLDIYMWSLHAEDKERLPEPEEAQMRHHPDLRWIDYLEGDAPGYPFLVLQGELQSVQQTTQRLKNGARLTSNPVSTSALINLMLGGPDPGGSTHGPLPLHAQVRYFDPINRRAGLPEDVAALVESIESEKVTLILVNLNPLEERTVTIQTGAYAEHQAKDVVINEESSQIDAPYFNVQLAPGSGAKLIIDINRYVNKPTLSHPWDRWWMVEK